MGRCVGEDNDVILEVTFSVRAMCPPGVPPPGAHPPGIPLVGGRQRPCCGRSFEHLLEVLGSLVQGAGGECEE